MGSLVKYPRCKLCGRQIHPTHMTLEECLEVTQGDLAQIEKHRAALEALVTALQLRIEANAQGKLPFAEEKNP
jgi:hypothetical protein